MSLSRCLIFLLVLLNGAMVFLLLILHYTGNLSLDNTWTIWRDNQTNRANAILAHFEQELSDSLPDKSPAPPSGLTEKILTFSREYSGSQPDFDGFYLTSSGHLIQWISSNPDRGEVHA